MVSVSLSFYLFSSAPIKKKYSVSFLPGLSDSAPKLGSGSGVWAGQRGHRVPRRRPAVRSGAGNERAGLGRFPLSAPFSGAWAPVSPEGRDSGGAAVVAGRAAMRRGQPRRSRGGARPPPQPPAKPLPRAERQGAQLWLFPSAPGLRSALSRRSEAPRQVCCTRGRLAVLERGGACVQVHQLPAGSAGAQKPSEWGAPRAGG